MDNLLVHDPIVSDQLRAMFNVARMSMPNTTIPTWDAEPSPNQQPNKLAKPFTFKPFKPGQVVNLRFVNPDSTNAIVDYDVRNIWSTR
jgi:hypothetical protein